MLHNNMFVTKLEYRNVAFISKFLKFPMVNSLNEKSQVLNYSINKKKRKERKKTKGNVQKECHEKINVNLQFQIRNKF